MGTYVKSAAAKDYKRLQQSGSSAEDRHASLIRQVGPDVRVFAIMDRGIFELAADVTTLGEFKEFDGQYRRGELLSMVFVAIPASDVDAIQQ